MNEAEFLALPPRERDAAVAVARGWTPPKDEWGIDPDFWYIGGDPQADESYVWVESFHPTSYIAAAWGLVEEMRAGGWMFSLDDLGFDGEKWRVRFDKDRDVSGEWHIGEHDDERVAICLAYMKARGAIT